MTFSRRGDFFTALALIAFSIYVYREGAAMPHSTRGLGPGGYPIFIAVGIGILGIILAIQSLYKYRKEKGKPIFTLSASALWRAGLFVAASTVYVLALEPLGFVLTSFVYLLWAIHFFGYRRPGVNVAVSVTTTLVVYAVFRYCFLVLLPTGTLFS